jgi:hypothetical protein
MIRSLKMGLIGIALPAALIIGIAGAVLPSEKPECEIAHEWAIAHRGTLPTTHAEISKYSLIYRRAIYSELPEAARAALWREHLSSYAGSDSPLNQGQKALVAEAIANIEAYWSGPAGKARLKLLEPRLHAAFDKQLGKEVFATLGTPEPPRSPEAATATVGTFRSLFRGASTIVLPNCSCSTDSDWCGGTTICVDTNTCDWTTIGCGTLFSYPCDGKCSYLER